MGINQVGNHVVLLGDSIFDYATYVQKNDQKEVLSGLKKQPK